MQNNQQETNLKGNRKGQVKDLDEIISRKQNRIIIMSFDRYELQTNFIFLKNSKYFKM